MDRLTHKRHNQERRAHRTRTLVKGTAERPRLSVHVSNLNITAQIIDDTSGKTLAYATTTGKPGAGTMNEQAAALGKEIAALGKRAKVKRVSFDRGGKKYHGRLKSLAEAARKEGMEF